MCDFQSTENRSWLTGFPSCIHIWYTYSSQKCKPFLLKRNTFAMGVNGFQNLGVSFQERKILIWHATLFTNSKKKKILSLKLHVIGRQRNFFLFTVLLQLTLSNMDTILSRWHTDIFFFFFFFSWKQIWHFMQVVSKGKQFEWNVKPCFLEKWEKYQFIVCWITPESVKD